ncbi:MAG: glutamine--fructose-6-phosphate transaminase (isomerizing) [Patescibacteria group bacterium]|jgi:glucosamine--fructose-6-phosphate aminotransferase (isomerizing)|nr:glutamine--fructose-6-phosphate transaminase (isomerizing) [Patescibacteria group bacterium]
MCGIIGYIGTDNGVDYVLDGLKNLEYRGYDSSGICIINSSSQTNLIKQVGGIDKLVQKVKTIRPNGKLIIGHTRWATHGKPSISNAHPHFNNDHNIFVVHNGIIENYLEIKSKLIDRGYKFVSETDSEVIPNLVDFYYKKIGSLSEAFRMTLDDLRGTYAICLVSTIEPDKLFVSRLGSPLVIGKAGNKIFVSSDPSAITNRTKSISFLNDYDVAQISLKKIKVFNQKDNKPSFAKFEIINQRNEQNNLGDWPNYMIKEINQAPEVVELAIKGRLSPKHQIKLGGLDDVSSQLDHIDRIIIVGCGTSYYAGLIGEYLIEEFSDIPVEVELGSEFKYKNEPISRSTCLIAISQSGETADTIAAINKVKDFGVLKLGIVNSIGSTISRITDAGVYCHAGNEKSVASTKAFIAQVTVLSLLALRLAKIRTKSFDNLSEELLKLPDKIRAVLGQSDQIQKLAHKYIKYKNFLFIGRKYNYPIALEGALKLKEVSYVHAEGYSAGEMKHGPIALIDKTFPTIVIATKGDLYKKTISNLLEIRSRGGPIVLITNFKDQKIKNMVDDLIYVPESHEETATQIITVALQLFAYYFSLELGNNIDKPRNLAKSVTVE